LTIRNTVSRKKDPTCQIFNPLDPASSESILCAFTSIYACIRILALLLKYRISKMLIPIRMKIFNILEAPLRQIVDYCYARWPQAVPDRDRLQHCKIISHRGDCDNQIIFENTIAAFDRAEDQGVWGIEFDLRWTRDLNPVVIHDADLVRVFGFNHRIRQMTLAELKSCCPLVPSLGEMIHRYGKKIHLMIEIKAEHYPEPGAQNRILEDLLSPLVPEADYHLLTLNPDMFGLIECAPRSALLPVAHLNFFQLSKLAIEKGYSGIAGHYLLLTRSRLKMHRAFNQKLATGYVNSKNCLFRELNRGVEWIFSDNAVELQKVVNQLLQDK
jgi:glycerophosphoryl diester phosphodiesterase